MVAISQLLRPQVAALVLNSCSRGGLRMDHDAASAPRPEPALEAVGSSRRSFVSSAVSSVLLAGWAGAAQADRLPDEDAQPPQFTPMAGLRGKDYGKPKMRFTDFTETSTGLQYKDIRTGNGETPADGDRVVIDWEGYTIGYYGRPFEKKNGVQGGAFASDQDFIRFILGKGTMIPAIEEAVRTMAPGGIRQLVVPPELGYPPSDPRHDKVGPRPDTFSGQRALDFVLENQGFIDKTLLINIEVMRVDKPGQRGFRGL